MVDFLFDPQRSPHSGSSQHQPRDPVLTLPLPPMTMVNKTLHQTARIRSMRQNHNHQFAPRGRSFTVCLSPRGFPARDHVRELEGYRNLV